MALSILYRPYSFPESLVWMLTADQLTALRLCGFAALRQIAKQ